MSSYFSVPIFVLGKLLPRMFILSLPQPLTKCFGNIKCIDLHVDFPLWKMIISLSTKQFSNHSKCCHKKVKILLKEERNILGPKSDVVYNTPDGG